MIMLLTSVGSAASSLELITIWLSSFAILVSIISLGINFVLDRKLNHVNIKSSIYQKIFDEYILIGFPEGLGKVIDCKNKKYIKSARNDLDTSVKSCLKKINFFVIEDNNTYEKLRSKLILINEILYGFTSPYKDLDKEKNRLTCELRSFYRLIFDKYKKG